MLFFVLFFFQNMNITFFVSRDSKISKLRTWRLSEFSIKRLKLTGVKKSKIKSYVNTGPHCDSKGENYLFCTRGCDFWRMGRADVGGRLPGTQCSPQHGSLPRNTRWIDQSWGRVDRNRVLAEEANAGPFNSHRFYILLALITAYLQPY